MADCSVLVCLLALLPLGWCQTKFDCPALPPLLQPARTVHELKPQDIKVVMALGDSATAGKTMHAMADLQTERLAFVNL